MSQVQRRHNALKFLEEHAPEVFQQVCDMPNDVVITKAVEQGFRPQYRKHTR